MEQLFAATHLLLRGSPKFLQKEPEGNRSGEVRGERGGLWCSPSAGCSVPGRTAGLTAPEPGAGSSPRKEPETMGEKKKKMQKD